MRRGAVGAAPATVWKAGREGVVMADQLHVVFGAHGPLGAAIVRYLAREGLSVRAVVRRTAAARFTWSPRVEVFYGDALYRHSAIEAAEGASVVYRCIPVRYSLWADVWQTATDNIIAAADGARARLVSPGNVYVYGDFSDGPADESHPLAPTGEKGTLRVGTQEALWRAHREGRVEVVIPRGPDPFGPCVTNRVFGPIFEGAQRGRSAPWFGDPDVRRDFLFVDDIAAAAVLLGQTPDAYGQVWHVPGAGPITPRDFIEKVYRAAGREPKLHQLSPAAVRLKGMVDAETREFLEFRYLFEKPSVLDGGKFAARFPDFKYTPHEQAIERTLDWFAARKAEEAMERATC